MMSSIIAHRGVSSLFPENTLIAVRAAEKINVPWVELDLQVLQDLTPVIFHDYDLARTTDGSGTITDYTIDTLQSIDAGSWFDERFRKEKIPTLHDLLLSIEDFDMGLNLEIKYYQEIYGDMEPEKISEVVHSIMRVISYSPKPSRGILISSFYHPFLQEIKKYNAPVKIGVLLNTFEERYKELACSLDAVSIHMPARILFEDYAEGAKIIESIKKEHLHVYCFTVNEEEEATMAFDMGVGGIFTDYPQSFIRYLSRDGE